MTEKVHFFGYGTLQPDSNLRYFEENELSQYLKPVCKAETQGSLVHLKNNKLNIEYPGMIVSNNAGRVKGTLFEVSEPDVAFKLMDSHELYTHEPGSSELTQIDLYERRNIAVDHGGQEMLAVAYVLNQNSQFLKSGVVTELGVVESGDWLDYIKQRPPA